MNLTSQISNIYFQTLLSCLQMIFPDDQFELVQRCSCPTSELFTKLKTLAWQAYFCDSLKPLIYNHTADSIKRCESHLRVQCTAESKQK